MNNETVNPLFKDLIKENKMTLQTVYHMTYPVANHILSKKWDMAKQERHLNQLKAIKTVIDMKAPIGYGQSDEDNLERSRKETIRLAKDHVYQKNIDVGNVKIAKKIASMKLDTHREWINIDTKLYKSPLRPFVEKRVKEVERIERDNNKIIIKVESLQSATNYQKAALLNYYDINKNTGRKYIDVKPTRLHHPTMNVRVKEEHIVPRTISVKPPTNIVTRKPNVKKVNEQKRTPIKSETVEDKVKTSQESMSERKVSNERHAEDDAPEIITEQKLDSNTGLNNKVASKESIISVVVKAIIDVPAQVEEVESDIIQDKLISKPNSIENIALEIAEDVPESGIPNEVVATEQDEL